MDPPLGIVEPERDPQTPPNYYQIKPFPGWEGARRHSYSDVSKFLASIFISSALHFQSLVGMCGILLDLT
jgi:hypothetical protein